MSRDADEELPAVSHRPPSENMSQPEQEMPPQVSAGAEASDVPLAVTEMSVIMPDQMPDASDIPLPDDLDEGLYAGTPHDEEALLTCEVLDPADSHNDLCQFETLIPGTAEEAVFIAEDGLPFVEDPLEPRTGYAYCLEIPLRQKDIKKWRTSEHPEEMAHIASVGRKARVKVKLKELSPAEVQLFREAKSKELSSWVQTNAIKRILRSRLNPSQILKSRWVLTWKHPDPQDVSVKKAKARLVVLGYQDPMLTKVSRDSPTLSKEGRATVLQTIASCQWKLRSFDISTAFLRGKADDRNPLAMEPPEELRQLLGLRDDEVCSLLGNAYGRVDAPLLFYKELNSQLLKLGFRHHPLDPCVYILESFAGSQRTLHGVLGMHVDDGVG